MQKKTRKLDFFLFKDFEMEKNPNLNKNLSTNKKPNLKETEFVDRIVKSRRETD